MFEGSVERLINVYVFVISISTKKNKQLTASLSLNSFILS